MKQMWPYIRRYFPLYGIAVASMAISILLDAVSPQITRKIIDEVIIGGNRSILVPLLLGILGIGLGRAVFQYTKEFIFDYSSSGIGCRLRKDLFDHMQTLSVSYFDSHNTGELMARAKDDVDRVWDACGYVEMLTLECIIHTYIIVSCMFRISPVLTLVPLLIMPVIMRLAVKMENGLGNVYDKISEETAEMNTVAQENLAGVRTVKAFAREAYEVKKFKSHNQRFYELNMEQAKLVARYQPWISFFSRLLSMLVIICGGIFVIRGKITLGSLGAFWEYANNITWPMEMADGFGPVVETTWGLGGFLLYFIGICIIGAENIGIGTFLAFSTYIAMFWSPVRNLANFYNKLTTNISAAERIFDILDTPAEIRDKEGAGKLPPLRGEVEFSHVSFAYSDEPDRMVLKDVSFKVKPGETIALVGPTGAGKTTIVNLISRFYEAQEGDILLDGHEVKEVTLESLRRQLGIMTQDNFLFSGTIRENIRYGRLDATDEEVIEAAKAVNAHVFIEQLEKGYDTEISERGARLSIGQRQLLAFARTMISRPGILILDEATSSIDTHTEILVQKGIDALLKERTSFIVAHRLSTIRKADRIFVIDQGTILEEGNHQELMEKKGAYYQLYRSQFM